MCLPARLLRAFQTLHPEDALLTGVPSSWGHRGPVPRKDFPAQGVRPVALPSRLEDGRSCSVGVTLHWTQGFPTVTGGVVPSIMARPGTRGACPPGTQGL